MPSRYSRQLTIVDAANEFSRGILKKRVSKTLFVVTPRGYQHMGRILQLLEQSGFMLISAKMVQFERGSIQVLTPHILCQAGPASTVIQDAQLTQDVSILIEMKQPAPNALEDVMHKLDTAGLLYSSVMLANVGMEIFTGACAGKELFPSTAVFDNCTVCLIKPRMVRDGHVGEILDAILSTGFEISALKLIHLQMNDADEFFRVYKGIIWQYHEVLKYMCSAPCIALEIRGEDVVNRFREFCGPFDVQIAKMLRPQTLRAKFGLSNLHNALHCTDCPEDGAIESQFIFHSLASN